MKPNLYLQRLVAIGLGLGLAACSSVYPPKNTGSINHINDTMKEASARRAEPAAVPEAVSASLLPPARKPRPRVAGKSLEPRFDLVVSGARIDEVLMGMVHDTRYSIMLRPRTLPAGVAAQAQADIVTLNLKNVTVFEALDSLREVYGYDYAMDGNRIYVQPPELQTRLYQVDYVIGQRKGVSDLQVIGGASVGSTSSGSSGTSSGTSGSTGGGSGSSYASVQAGALSTMAKSDLWGEIEDSVRTALGCQIPKKTATTGRGSAGAGAVTGGATGTSTSSSSSSASRADLTFDGDSQTGERQRGVDGCSEGRAMNINQMSGTILVRGMPAEHRMIAQVLRTMQVKIERQVIIEAKIIDVALNSGTQQGVNWAAFDGGMHRMSVGSNASNIGSGAATNGGTVAAATSLGGLLGTGLAAGAAGTPISAGLGVALQLRNFSVMLSFLESQGSVNVLSSPRIATLNNQKAILKVGKEEPFVTNASGGAVVPGTGGSATTTTNPSITYQPFFSGISLDVTPQIDSHDGITLHVHTIVNQITSEDKTAIINPAGGNNITLPFAVNNIKETDSVVKTRDGQIVVIGGLMQDDSIDVRRKVPGVGDVPAAGGLFRNGTQSATKRELVILLKPTIVKDENTWADAITESQQRIEAMVPAEAK